MGENVKSVPEGLHTLTPHIVCAGAAEAIEFYKKAFGATEFMRMPGPDGKLMHASVKIGDSMLMLVDEMPQWGALGPKARNGTSVTIHLAVANVDEVFAQAVSAGAKMKMPVADMFWGDRYGIVVDPFGHEWSIATRIRNMTPDEMVAAGREAMQKGCAEAGKAAE
ncbi:VOC family protein [Methylocystis sp. ATCC 49242]|uniref:VOC family protein n=1 Tax=Methylocystis sp. ATCC 49242 TaxID=622637 RepID=UPI0001F87A67|nr:VOC family protein [Methylocystis sp. ATCC 49242]